MWNNISLKPPPTNSYRALEHSVDTVSLKTPLNELVNVINDYRDLIIVEKNLLCDILYKYKIRLKKNVEIKLMFKINKYLDVYKKLDLIKDISNFLHLVPNQKNKTDYLPTKQMFQYVLLRIQGFSKLFNKIIYFTSYTAKYMINKLSLGHYWTFALAVLSIVSRVWEISYHIVDECCACYKKIIPIHKKLKLFGSNWISDSYEFPTDLRVWLNITRTFRDLNSLPHRKLNDTTYIISDDEEDDIQFMGSYKNDYIIIDDSMQLNNDVEFVNEYIDLLSTPKNKSFFFKNTDLVIDLESDNSENQFQDINDIEIIADDIGEIVDRSTLSDSSKLITSTPLRKEALTVLEREKKKKKSNSGCQFVSTKKMRKDDKHITIENVNESVICLSVLNYSMMQEKDKHGNISDIEDSKKNQNANVIEVDSTIIFSEDSDVNTVVTVDSNLSESDVDRRNLNVTNINLKNHNLDSIKNIRTLKNFLATEKILRSKNHKNCLTKNVSKNTWTKIIKKIEKVFLMKKRTKQTKNIAVQSAKNIIKKYVTCK